MESFSSCGEFFYSILSQKNSLINKKVCIVVALLVYSCALNAQVLYTDDFDNYNTGYLGTDYKGQIPGQGGWFTHSWHETKSHTPFTITTETGKGKVLNITSPFTNRDAFWIYKRNLNNLIANRTPGNNVIKFEIDYFTGVQQNFNAAGNNSGIYVLYNNDVLDNTWETLIQILFDKVDGRFVTGFYQDPDMNFSNSTSLPQFSLPFNTWIKINVYLDYSNRKAYLDVPYFGSTYVSDFLKNSTSANLLKDFPPSTILLRIAMQQEDLKFYYTVNKYDDIKLTALNVVPPEVITNLNVNNHLAQQFNLYPNPATHTVNITNNENIVIEKVTVFDVSGKEINTYLFTTNESNALINTSNWASGTYLLHLHTKQGVAVKKVVKK